MGDIVNQLEHCMHVRVLAQDVLELKARSAAAIVTRPPRLARSARARPAALPNGDDRRPPVSSRNRKRQPNRLHRLIDAAVPGRHDDRDRQATLLNLADQIHAVQFRHGQVGEDDAVIVLGQRSSA